MKFREAFSKMFTDMFQLVRVTTVQTDTFNVDVNQMQYVKFSDCNIGNMKLRKGQNILLNGAYIGVLTSDAKLEGNFNIVEKTQ